MTRPVVNQPVVVPADIVGTGVRKGHVGKVIFVQENGRATGRSTDLAATAFQVRFKGGAEIWVAAEEIAPLEVAGGAPAEIVAADGA